jgi:hypothetical protein
MTGNSGQGLSIRTPNAIQRQALKNESYNLYLRNLDNGGTARIDMRKFDGTTAIASFLENGNVGIGTTSPSARLSVNGNIYAVNNITTQSQFYDLLSSPQGGAALCRNGTNGAHSECSSDRRLKKNIMDIDGHVLDKVLKLMPVEFDWINQVVGRQAGFIAQDVKALFPLTVGGDETNGYLTFTPGNLVPYLVMAIKEQQAEIDNLKSLVCLDHPDAEVCK